MTTNNVARPDETLTASANDLANEPVHPHYAAPPPSKEVSGEGRMMQALSLAAWVGKLIDPLIHRDPEKEAAKSKLP